MIRRVKSITSFIILIFLAFSCNTHNEPGLVMQLNCDVEIVEKVGDRMFLTSPSDSLLTGAEFRTEKEARSGKYSVKLGYENKYAFQVKFKNLEKDMFLRATIWFKGDVGHLAFTGPKALNFQKYSKLITQEDDKGWKQIILEAFVPANYNGEELKLFAMNQFDSDAYFDDLEVHLYKEKNYPKYNEIDNIELSIDQEYLDEINKNRIKSFIKGVITNKTKKTYPAIFSYGNESYSAEVRIKGDWTDHIQGNKLSFRIKLLEGNFRGMKEFSIQQPQSRDNLNEFVVHKLFEEEDVLTTRYGFVPVKVNGNNRGIFAVEEHFSKNLIEARDRREGPILKFSEKAFWVITQKNLKKDSNFIKAPFVESSIITPFKKGKLRKNENLKHNFILAQNLLKQYQLDSSPVSELFKIDRQARFYAITDITLAWHSTRWHNERFYYDPVSSRLENVAYDCFTANSSDNVNFEFTPEIIELNKEFNYDQYLKVSPFNDPKFVKEYIKVMEYYLNSDRLQSIISKYENDITNNMALIKKEYSYYAYDPYYLIRGISELTEKWKNTKAKLEEGLIHADLAIGDYAYANEAPISGMNLQAFQESNNEISISNYHSQKLYLIAYSNKKLPEQGIVNFPSTIEFDAYSGIENLVSKKVTCTFAPTKIYFKTNVDSVKVYTAKVMAWPEPILESPRQELMKLSIRSTNRFISVEDSIYRFKKGNHVISKPIVIPEGKIVIIEEGVHLDFINHSFFMSFSPLQIKGKANDPVLIESSDGSAMGFTTIDADHQSEIDHVIFKGFNTLSYQGWNLTGAVTFYESDVTITNTQFLENHCEDALNIIRSDFSMTKSLIADAYADGFDADFATGIVANSVFERIGNDGIDFSGSIIEIVDVTINNIGDKGISGGENSTLALKNITVSNANIGVASKDRSVVNINGIKISDSYCAFAVYQKKSEYEPAKIFVENSELNNIEREDLLGLGSIIIFDGKQFQGKVKINIDSLYGL